MSQNNAYDAWGSLTYGGNIDQHLTWKGLWYNGDLTGLYYVRNRWYDPEGGRFVNEDPAGFAGGDNLYAYTGDDPVNGKDPTGLSVSEPCTREAIEAAWNAFLAANDGFAYSCANLGTTLIFGNVSDPDWPPEPSSPQMGGAGGFQGGIRAGGGGRAGSGQRPAPKYLTRACFGYAANLVLTAGLDYVSWGEFGKALVVGKSGRVLLQKYESAVLANVYGLPVKGNVAAAVSRPVAAGLWNLGGASLSGLLTAIT